MTDYNLVFGTLGAELKNLRKPEAVFEDFHFTSVSTYAKRLVNAAYDDTDVMQEAAHNVASVAYERSVAGGMTNLLSSLKQSFEGGWFPVLDGAINTNPSDKSIGAIAYAYDGNLTDGTIAISARGGRWGALRQKMIADRQVILANTVTFGAMTPTTQNVGKLTLTSISGSDHTLSGVLSILCTDDTVEAPKFTVLNTLAKKSADQSVGSSADGLFSLIPAENVAQMAKSFQDGPTGISMQLDVGVTITQAVTDPSGIIEMVSPVPGIAWPTEGDTNKGKIYIKVTRMSADPTWYVVWARDAAFFDIVTTTSVNHATPNVSMNGPNGTHINFTIKNSVADVVMPGVGDHIDTVVFDFNMPRLNDQWQITVTNAENGLFATKLAHFYRASLNSATAKPASAATAALAGAGAGNVDNGTHAYSYSYVVNGVETGESAASNIITVVDKTVNGKVSLTGITAGPSGTTARKIYRTIAGNTGSRLLVGTISDNVTTVFTDNLADSGLGVAAVQQIDDTLATSVSMV